MEKNRLMPAVGLFILILGAVLGYVGRGSAAPEAALPGSEQDPLVTRSYVEQKFRLQVVEVPKGERLIGFAGTEIILRAGDATAIDSESGGLSDVTLGKDLRQGDTVEKNHLLVVPRDDGRGLMAKTNLIVLVRGDFSIQK